MDFLVLLALSLGSAGWNISEGYYNQRTFSGMGTADRDTRDAIRSPWPLHAVFGEYASQRQANACTRHIRFLVLALGLGGADFFKAASVAG